VSLVTLIVIIAVIGICVWAANRYLPIDANFKQIIVVVAVVFCVLLALQAFGVVSLLRLPLK